MVLKRHMRGYMLLLLRVHVPRNCDTKRNASASDFMPEAVISNVKFGSTTVRLLFDHELLLTLVEYIRDHLVASLQPRVRYS